MVRETVGERERELERAREDRERESVREIINQYLLQMRLQGDDWTRKLPVEVRILLMQLMNIESKVRICSLSFIVGSSLS